MSYLWKRQVQDGPLPSELLEDRVLSVIQGYAWPGNVREVEHFIRAYRIWRATGGGPKMSPAQVEDLMIPIDPHSKGRWKRRRPSREEVERAIERAGGNLTKAAGALGISRQTLYRIRGASD
jgi:transcriptional regulator of acetoin/glycerol metabolism